MKGYGFYLFSQEKNAIYSTINKKLEELNHQNVILPYLDESE